MIIIAGSFFYFKSKPVVDSNGVKLSTLEVDKVVNKYIQQTSTESLRQKLLADRAIEKARQKIAELNEANRIRQQKELEKIPVERQIWREAEVRVEQPQVQQPSKAVSGELGMSDDEKREYARQYIENARRGGYAIELNDNLEVIKWTPLRKPSQDDSYESLPSN